MVATKSHLRNRAEDRDRPIFARDCREVDLVKPESTAPNRCKEGEGHSHVFQRDDNYGCCTVCGDEVLT